MKLKFTRSFYVGSSYVPLESEPEFGLEVFGSPAGSLPVYGVAFAGKRQKPDWHYRFKSEEARAAYIKSYKEKLEGIAEYKLKRAIERKEVENLLKVGDILKCSWGYEQTNIDYYEVVKVLPKSVVICEIGQRKEVEGYESGRCWPIPGSYRGKYRTVRVKGDSVRISSYSSAYLVKPNADGTYPEAYWTSYH
jgi:hypothetical protein